jgi:charged multivesicular body protein 3
VEPHIIVGMTRISGCLQKSTAVMAAMNSLVRLPEIQATMMEMSKEMMKVSTANLMQEIDLQSHL